MKKQRLILVAVWVVFLLAIGSNEYIRAHRNLYVVNGFEVPVQIELDGPKNTRTYEIPPGVQRLTVNEGGYVVTVRKPTFETILMVLESGYLERWTQNPVWILNPANRGILVLNTRSATEAGRPEYYWGDRVMQFTNVNMAFDPDRKTDHRTGPVLDVYRGKAMDVFRELCGSTGSRQTYHSFAFGEMWLEQHPDDVEMLHAYATVPQVSEYRNRAVGFISRGLTNQPQVEWQRALQIARGTR